MNRLATILVALAASILPRSAATQEAAAPVPRVIRGEVVPSDGGRLDSLLVRVRVTGEVDSAVVDPAGRFSVRLPPGAPDDIVELRVDAVDPSARRYIPALVRAVADSLAGEQRIVLVPREWVIPAGAFAGEAVEIRLERAFAPLCPDCSSFYRRGYVGVSLRERNVLRTWPERVFPLRVAFDREGSAERILPRDSIAFWRIVGEMEATFGMDLFRPARYQETLPLDDLDSDDVVLVRTDPTLRVSGLGSTAAQGSDIIYGELLVRWMSLITGADGASLVMHELMHTLGLGHTCAWRSIMAAPTYCPAMRSPVLTAQDVAHAQLVRRVRDLQRIRGARWGIDAALAGERVVQGKEEEGPEG
ncbi:MAG TPA: hypothetical protein VHG28_04580 [Longimicrobiaceae bacterium]|nr:hypothetical protein [Longimicrobiaceae bacterium]